MKGENSSQFKMNHYNNKGNPPIRFQQALLSKNHICTKPKQTSTILPSFLQTS